MRKDKLTCYQAKHYEDFFTLGTTVGQISRALTVIAEDTDDRRDSPEDVRANMGVLHLLADRLSQMEADLEALDNLHCQIGSEISNVL